MSNGPFISKSKAKEKSKDYSFLREEGLKYIQQFSETTWTDHNIHDPGITILEILCYAITELGYKTNLNFRDILESSERNREQDFFLPHEIFPVHPVTTDDFRKILIDHDSIRNAWVIPSDDIKPNIFFNVETATLNYNSGEKVKTEGFYDVLLEFQEDNLNSNIVAFEFPISLNGNTVEHIGEIAFPYWDDERIVSMERDLRIVRVCGLQDENDPNLCNPIQLLRFSDGNSNDYFADLTVSFEENAVINTMNFGITIKITSSVNDPDEIPLIETAIIEQLGFDPLPPGSESLSQESIIKQYNSRVIEVHRVVSEVKGFIQNHRNLCEDFLRFRAINIQEIAIQAEIEIASGTNVEMLLAEIFFNISKFLSPEIRFYTLQEMLDKQIPVEEIFEGPLLSNGFIEIEELKELDGLQEKAVIYTSDLVNLIMNMRADLRNIIAVENFSISNFINNRLIQDRVTGCLNLVNTDQFKARLTINKSKILFFREGIEITYNHQTVNDLFQELTASDVLIAGSGYNRLDLPKGQALPIEDYFSVQNEFPLTYQIGPGGISPTAPIIRKAQANQLKGYLLHFEQLLADYLAQLTHINNLFSIQLNETQTYFWAPLYNVPDAQNLLKSFNAETDDWNAFILDEGNEYVSTLTKSIETPELFLERRDKFLDHLMARFGEEMIEYSLFKTGEPTGNTPENNLMVRNLLRQELIREKALFIQNIPFLSAERMKATVFSVIAKAEDIVILENISGDSSIFTWQLQENAQTILLQSASDFTERNQALAAAESALQLATNRDHYEIIAVPGGLSFQLYDGPVGASTNVIGIREEVFLSAPNADEAIEGIIARYRNVWNTFNISGFEKRIIHKIGMKSQKRRDFSTDIDEFFEVFDINPGNPTTELRFHLRDDSGAEMLISEAVFADENTARTAIAEVVRLGILISYYEVLETNFGYQIQLKDENNLNLANSISVFENESEAWENIYTIISFLHEKFSGEVFHLIEHILLRPQNPGEEFLLIRNEEGQLVSDPYSFRLTLFFPSGYTRDFSAVPPENPVPANPERFQNPDYRRLIEKTIKKECPAHLLPHTYWVDSDSSNSADVPSFNNLEIAFRNWLQIRSTFNADPALLINSRNALIIMMNRIANG